MLFLEDVKKLDESELREWRNVNQKTLDLIQTAIDSLKNAKEIIASDNDTISAAIRKETDTDPDYHMTVLHNQREARLVWREAQGVAQSAQCLFKRLFV